MATTTTLVTGSEPRPQIEHSSFADLDVHLRQVQDRYTEDNPKSCALFKEDLKHMPGANTRSVLAHDPFPLTIARGESCRLWDVDGHEYVDFLGEYSAGIYGHSCEAIKHAVADAMDKGWSFGGKNLYEGKLAKLIVERFSYSMELVRFTNSGTEANLMALAAATNFTGRDKILVFRNGYHGGALMFMENESQYSLNAKFDFVVAPYNDIAAVDAALSALPRDSLAAILVEPMQVSGGCVSGDRAFLQHLRQVATTHKAVLIFDEVMTSRLSYGGLQVELGIRPDLTTVGKWLGGGMSFGAFGGLRDIMDMFDPRTGRLSHSGTFNNNVITMAAGVTGCQLMTKARIEGLNALGDRLRSRIAETFKARIDTTDGQSPKIFVIGAGSLFAIRFLGRDHKILSKLLYHHLLENGVYIAARGFLALTIEITEEHFRPLLGALESFIDKYRTWLA